MGQGRIKGHGAKGRERGAKGREAGKLEGWEARRLVNWGRLKVGSEE